MVPVSDGNPDNRSLPYAFVEMGSVIDSTLRDEARLQAAQAIVEQPGPRQDLLLPSFVEDSVPEAGREHKLKEIIPLADMSRTNSDSLSLDEISLDGHSCNLSVTSEPTTSVRLRSSFFRTFSRKKK